MKRLIVLVFALALLCPVVLAQQTEPQVSEDEIRTLIDELGDDSFQVREKAEQRLIGIGEPAIPFLTEAMESDDAEVAHRAERAIEAIRAADMPETTPPPEPQRPGIIPLPGRELEGLPDEVREMLEDLIERLRNEEMPEVPELPEGEGEPGEQPPMPLPFGGGASTRVEMGPDGTRTVVTTQDGTTYEKFVDQAGSVEITVTRPDGTVEEHQFESDEAFRLGEPELYEEIRRYTGGIVLRFNSGESENEDEGGFGIPLPEDMRRRFEEMEERMRRMEEEMRRQMEGMGRALPEELENRLRELRQGMRERFDGERIPDELRDRIDELEGELVRRFEEGAGAIPEDLLGRLEELENELLTPPEPSEPACMEELGAVVERPDETVRYQFELGPNEGAVVTAIIDPQGVLARAGLQSWDLVTRFNGQTVTSPEHLAELIGALGPGDSFTLTVYRRLEELTLVGVR